jgi:hypothetical protein
LGFAGWRPCYARGLRLQAQDDPLNKVHVPPPTTATPGTAEPKGAEAPAATGPDALKIHPGSRIRMNVDMVLVPVTVTDPMNRLVTGLEQEDFQVFENNGGRRSSASPARMRRFRSASSSIFPVP